MSHQINTQELKLEISFIQPVIKAILHTVLFHRHFGNVRPREAQIFSNITYTYIDDPDIISIVNDKVDELIQSTSSTADSKVQLSLSFTEVKARKAWFSKTEEEICWEEWVFNIQLQVANTEREKNQLQESAREQVKQTMFRVITEMDRNKEHIPLISNTHGNPFPFHISVTSTAGLWSSMIKRAIRHNSQ